MDGKRKRTWQTWQRERASSSWRESASGLGKQLEGASSSWTESVSIASCRLQKKSPLTHAIAIALATPVSLVAPASSLVIALAHPLFTPFFKSPSPIFCLRWHPHLPYNSHHHGTAIATTQPSPRRTASVPFFCLYTPHLVTILAFEQGFVRKLQSVSIPCTRSLLSSKDRQDTAEPIP